MGYLYLFTHTTRKVKPIWILLKQETVSGSGIRWAVCKSAPRSRKITTQAPTRFFSGRTLFLTPNQQRHSTEGNITDQTYKFQKHIKFIKNINLYDMCN